MPETTKKEAFEQFVKALQQLAVVCPELVKTPSHITVVVSAPEGEKFLDAYLNTF